jgi:hypothetical protein
MRSARRAESLRSLIIYVSSLSASLMASLMASLIASLIALLDHQRSCSSGPRRTSAPSLSTC